MLILDLWGISFHAVVVFGMGKNFLFKSALGHCVETSQLKDLSTLLLWHSTYPGEKSQNARVHIDVTQTRIISLLSALWGNNEVPADFHAK